jgi:hypothetical protein
MANSYMTVAGPAPASYAGNPNFGLQLGQIIGNYPNDYMQGRENRQKIAMDDMFKDGLPKKEDGVTPDFDAAYKTYTDQGAKIKGGSFVAGFIPFMQDQIMGEQAAKIARGEPAGSGMFGASAPATQPLARPNNGTAGPGNLMRWTAPAPGIEVP